jgi:NAD(P)-dependent dehydrogenase (short-subunit alcohol dehydrogenase family)
MMTTSTTDTAGRGPALLGQTVVVIGGSSGIGLETARQARAEGAELVLAGLDRGRLEDAATELGAKQTAAFGATHSWNRSAGSCSG